MISNKIENKAILVASIIFFLLFLYKFFPYYYFAEENKGIVEREFEQSIHRFNNQKVNVRISGCKLTIKYNNYYCEHSVAVGEYRKIYDLRYMNGLKIKKSINNLSVAVFNFKNSAPREAFQIKYQYCSGKEMTIFGSDRSDIFMDQTEFLGSISRNISAYIYRNCK